MAKKKKSNIPRRKRMKRVSRLESAKHWLPKYEGKNIVQGYRKYYGVDLLSAVSELEMLGVKVNPDYVKLLKQDQENRRKKKEKLRQQKQNEALSDDYANDQDCHYYYIAGYTSNGVPFGITWEEHYASQFYYIGGYKMNGVPYGITWGEVERSMPKDEYWENHGRIDYS